MSGDLVIAPSGRKRLTFVALMGTMVLLGLAVVVVTDTWTNRLAGLAFAGVGTALAFHVLRLERRPLAVVTDTGIEAARLGHIGWDEIRALRVQKGSHGELLCIDLTPERAKRPLCFPEMLLPMSPEELRFKIEGRAGRTYPDHPDG